MPEVFLDAINPMEIQDCIMIPFGLEFNIMPVTAVIPIVEMRFRMKCDDIFKCNDNSPFKT